MKKDTVVDLWNEFKNVPAILTDSGKKVIDTPEGFLGFPMYTDVEDIRNWFDVEFAQWGGLNALMDKTVQPDRTFDVETPDGILRCYAKHEGVDHTDDYPGIFVDLCYTEEQKTGKTVGDLICCVEYDSMKKHLQIVPYPDLSDDSPCPGDFFDPESGTMVVYNYGDSAKQVW